MTFREGTIKNTSAFILRFQNMKRINEGLFEGPQNAYSIADLLFLGDVVFIIVEGCSEKTSQGSG